MADGNVNGVDLSNIDIPDKDSLSSSIQQIMLNAANYKYQSSVADKGEFVYPETFEQDFALSLGYYEALSRCASTGDLYISSLSEQTNDLNGDFGVGGSYDFEGIINSLGKITESSSLISSNIVGNLAVFSAAIEETTGAIKVIREYVEAHIEEYEGLIVDGNLVIKDDDTLFQIMAANDDQFDIDLLKLAQKEAKKSSQTILSWYVKEFIDANFKQILADSSIDVALATVTEGNFFQALGSGVGTFITGVLKKGTENALGSEVAQKLISEELSKVLKLVGGSTAGAIVSFGANYVIKKYILDEQWTHEDTIKGVVTGAEAAVISVLGGLAGCTGGLSLIPAAITVAVTVITDGLIHDWYYTDGVPACFDPYSIKDHLKNDGFNVELINVNGQACVPKIAISVLKTQNYTEDEASFLVGMVINNENYLNMFKDENGEYTRDYYIYRTAYEYGLIAADTSLDKEFLLREGYSDTEVERIIELSNKFSSSIFSFDDVCISSTSKEISSKKLYDNSMKRK